MEKFTGKTYEEYKLLIARINFLFVYIFIYIFFFIKLYNLYYKS